MYHYVGDHYDPKVNTINNTLMHGLAVPTAVFDQQMEHLAARRYRTMSFTELRSIQTQPGPLPADAIVLTFDDGYVDFYTNAYPILKKYNLKATVYVITKFIGRQGYIDWDMIREMQNSGLITIGSHTTMHNNLPSLSLSTLSADLRTSKAELEEKLGVPVEDFCYPSGKYNSDVVNAVGTAGYKTATLTVYGRWFPQNHPLMMPRERVSGYLSIEAFRELY
jgi:peptidoglycan/xylan/chitin deacetylase (PgdA/CDA1 family)